MIALGVGAALLLVGLLGLRERRDQSPAPPGSEPALERSS
jgi:hypothetical protein